MVLCDRPVIEVCPVEWGRMPGRSVLQWDKDDCAAIGLVKFDLLGLGMLEALHRMVDLVGQFHGVAVDLAQLPQEDEVYDLLCRADTVGVFQVESRAQMGTLPRVAAALASTTWRSRWLSSGPGPFRAMPSTPTSVAVGARRRSPTCTRCSSPFWSGPSVSRCSRSS